jgi:hypothetical protein
LACHQGPELINKSCVSEDRRISHLRAATMRELAETLAPVVNIPPERQRFWVFINRRNHTFRPDAIEYAPDTLLANFCRGAKLLRLYVEDTKTPDLPRMPDDILLFIKQFNPHDETLTFVTTIIADQRWVGDRLRQAISAALKLPETTELDLYEEITKW